MTTSRWRHNDPEAIPLPAELADFARLVSEQVGNLVRTVSELQQPQCLVWAMNLQHPRSHSQAMFLARKLGTIEPGKRMGNEWLVVSEVLPFALENPALLGPVPKPGWIRAAIYSGDWMGFFHVPVRARGRVVNLAVFPVPLAPDERLA